LTVPEGRATSARTVPAWRLRVSVFAGTALLLALGLSCSAAAGAPAAAAGRDWLMVVVSENTDPAREAEFNRWYDDVDLPDVFTVPGYLRARRGRAEPVPEFPPAGVQPGEGRYVALYDIDSADIDGTIISMLLLARKMDRTGRSTDLLHVTERLYFRKYGPAVEPQAGRAASGDDYLYLVRVDCCAGDAATSAFNRWYDATLLPALMQVPGMQRATRYELHRVVMSDPIVVPRWLTVLEIRTSSATQAVAGVAGAMDTLHAAQRMDPGYRVVGATIYRKIKELIRPGTGAR
jgi:hypothetical protein